MIGRRGERERGGQGYPSWPHDMMMMMMTYKTLENSKGYFKEKKRALYAIKYGKFRGSFHTKTHLGEGQYAYYLTNICWHWGGGYTVLKCINPKVKVISGPEFERIYSDVTARHNSHKATGSQKIFQNTQNPTYGTS